MLVPAIAIVAYLMKKKQPPIIDVENLEPESVDTDDGIDAVETTSQNVHN